MHRLEDVASIVEKQNRWRRKECLNLIASENVMSPLAEKYYVSDFQGRYNEHNGRESYYCGTKYSLEIEELCNQIFRERFNTSRVDVRPISGAIANMVAYSAFAKPGDVIIALGIPNGAHVSTTRCGMAGVRGLKTVDMFFDPKRMNIDVDNTVKLVEKVRPRMVMLGASMFLFPEPVKEIRERIDPKIKIIYDASHVFGLIYGGIFQDPLNEGAELVTSSTHKTFPGPQGGIVIGSNSMSESDWEKVEKSIFPGLTSNTHIHRFPALAVTALEMDEFGGEYARQVVKNAKALAEGLYNRGFDVLCPDSGFTESHQVMVNVSRFGGGKPVAELLEASNIICNKMALPADKPQDATQNPSGIRLGVQELTRWGMGEEEMREVAELFKKAIIDGKQVKNDVLELKAGFSEVQYCFKVS